MKIPSNPVEPIKKANIDEFNTIKAKVLAELEGEVSAKDGVTAYDLFPETRSEIKLTAADSVRMRVEDGAMYKALGKVKN